MMNSYDQQFPFTAVAGQQLFKLALILVAVNPLIGGVLISGPRGSAKSTLAKALADIMPPISSDPDQQARSPFVPLPLATSEEMLVGTLNLQRVLDSQQVEFQPGLLAKADQGVLYVDEVNLLADNLVDQLLDVAASGINRVERDGISHQHPARFVLLGTMNPDEGELRPQLQDRFGLSVELSGQYDIHERVEIVRLREQFESNRQAFCQSFADQQQQLHDNILEARQRLDDVVCPQSQRLQIAEYCYQANVDGLRADIVWLQAARAHAAISQREQVMTNDVMAVAELVLNHRRSDSSSQFPPQSPPKSSSASTSAKSSKEPSSKPSERQTPSSTANAQPKSDSEPGSEAGSGSETGSDDGSHLDNRPDSTSQPERSGKTPTSGEWGQMPGQDQQMIDAPAEWLSKSTPRMKAKSHAIQRPLSRLSPVTCSAACKDSGQDLSSRPSRQRVARPSHRLDWFRSLAASLGQWPLTQIKLKPRFGTRKTLQLVLLDRSASVLADNGFGKAKGIVDDITRRAYLSRQPLIVIGFGNQCVEVVYQSQRASKQLSPVLKQLKAGGGTPLCNAIDMATDVQRKAQRRQPDLAFNSVIITDGRCRQAFDHCALHGEVQVIDIEQSSIKRGRAAELASALGAQYIPLPI